MGHVINYNSLNQLFEKNKNSVNSYLLLEINGKKYQVKILFSSRENLSQAADSQLTNLTNNKDLLETVQKIAQEIIASNLNSNLSKFFITHDLTKSNTQIFLENNSKLSTPIDQMKYQNKSLTDYMQEMLRAIVDPSNQQKPTETLLEELKKHILVPKDQAFAEAEKWPVMPLSGKYCPIMILGDVLTCLTYGLSSVQTTVQNFFPESSAAAFFATPTVQTVLQVIGTAAGIINMGVGIYSIYTAVRLWNTEPENARTQLIYGILCILVGILMTLMALGIIGTNPWVLLILTVLFAAPQLLLLIKDVIPKLNNYKKTVEPKLQCIQKLKEDIKNDTCTSTLNILWRLQDFYQVKDIKIDLLHLLKNFEKGSDKSLLIDKLQVEMGPEAARAAFKILQNIYEKKGKEEILQAMGELENKILEWKRVLYIRLVEEIVYILTTTVSIILVAFEFSDMIKKILEIGLEIGLFLSNLIPTIIDTQYPYLRDAPLGVKGINEFSNELNNNHQSVQPLQLVPMSAS